MQSGSNIFVNLTEAQWLESHKVIICAILGTDMVHHFEQISKTQVGTACGLRLFTKFNSIQSHNLLIVFVF